MAKINSHRIIASIDVGTTKILVLIAQLSDDKGVEIIGIGKAPSIGLSKGVVIDIADTVNSIKKAVEEAEHMAGIKIESAYVGISGGHISSTNSTGMISLKHQVVQESDIKEVIEVARAVPILEGHHILHTLPHYFIIDNQQPVYDPLTMYGVRLQAYVHIVTGNISCVRNLITCCERAGVMVKDIVLEQIASGLAVLHKDERELGVGMIDIGGGTSDIVLYQQNNIRYTKVLPIAGNHFTNDLAIGLRASIKEAERIKKEHDITIYPSAEADFAVDIIAADGIEKRSVPSKKINTILHARAQELFVLIARELQQAHVDRYMQTGLVLTGGGSLLPGMVALAQSQLQVPIRIGIPHADYNVPQSLMHPSYATGYGLLLYAADKKRQERSLLFGSYDTMNRIFYRMRAWISDLF